MLLLILAMGCSFASASVNGDEGTRPSDVINNWLVPISTSITLIVTSIGGWLSLREYRLKVKAETRLAESAERETDIKLLKLFTEVMVIAHARGGYKVSEKAIEKILSPDVLQQIGIPKSNIETLLEKSVIHIPVGFAAQDAAISAIWVLGKKHPLLTPVAIQALESLSTFKSAVAKGYLEDLKTTYKDKILAATEKLPEQPQ